MATFAEAEAEAHTHMDMDASKWTTRYIDTGEASTTFLQCVDDNGDLHIIEGIWRLIKAFMIMSDEHRDLCRRASASRGVVVRDGVIVPFLYFTNIFNRRAGTEFSLKMTSITDITALGNALLKKRSRNMKTKLANQHSKVIGSVEKEYQERTAADMQRFRKQEQKAVANEVHITHI